MDAFADSGRPSRRVHDIERRQFVELTRTFDSKVFQVAKKRVASLASGDAPA
jgi:hypothetical protein